MIEKSNKNKAKPVDFFLQEEIKSLKTLMVAYTLVILGAVIIYVLSKIADPKTANIPIAMEDWQWIFMIMFNFASSFYSYLVIRFRKRGMIFRAKYILFGGMTIMVTLLMLWVGSLWVFLGYLLLLTMAGFFYDWKLSLFTGICSSLAFSVIIFLNRPFETADWGIWVIYFLAILLVTSFINNRNYIFVKTLLQKQGEVEKERDLLEVRVQGRTKELQELNESLDEQVKEKTKEVRERLEELERFYRATIGRELKMAELKGEVEKLRKELEKHKEG